MNGFDNQHDHESYRQLLECWRAENSIKTIKFQFLLLTNAILVASVYLMPIPPDIMSNAHQWLYAVATLLSLTWLFSLGRTLVFQKAWQIRLQQMAATYPDDQRFHILDNTQALELIRTQHRWLSLCGAMPSRLYLLGIPAMFTLGWLTAWLISL
jgi:hypothetical protein